MMLSRSYIKFNKRVKGSSSKRAKLSAMEKGKEQKEEDDVNIKSGTTTISPMRRLTQLGHLIQLLPFTRTKRNITNINV
jgi:hypothetical protein